MLVVLWPYSRVHVFRQKLGKYIWCFTKERVSEVFRQRERQGDLRKHGQWLTFGESERKAFGNPLGYSYSLL